MKPTLQIEFESRHDCSKFKKLLLKDKVLKEFFDGKGERCIFLKFDTIEIKNKVAQTLLNLVKNISIQTRENKVDYLYVKK